MAIAAHALLITPSTMPQFTGNDNSNLNAAQITAIVGGGLLTEVYKQNVGEAFDTGLFALSYQTTFSNAPLDPQDADIDYVGGPTIPGQVFLYVKDGNQEPAFYIFDITSWNRVEGLDLRGFWPNQGAISHVTLLNRPGTVPPGTVPDGGGTLALLGLAVGAFEVIRRKLGTAGK